MPNSAAHSAAISVANVVTDDGRVERAMELQQALAKSGQLEGALQNLLALEKPARLVRAS